jgi:diguanylate cyclase (GGDEF)-like protein/PAS domain S-box-containing protein
VVVAAPRRAPGTRTVTRRVIDLRGPKHLHGNDSGSAASGTGATEVSTLRLPDGLLEQIVVCAPDGILAVDASGSIVFVNHQLEVLLGFHRDEVLGQPVEMLLPDQLRSTHAGYRREFAANPAVRPMGAGRTLRARCKDGSDLDVEISLAPLPFGEVTYVAVVMRDATDHVQAQTQLQHQALHDPLTGLPNRALLMDRLRTALARRAPSGIGVLFFDIDHLKLVNDSLGHAAGDVLLTSIGERVRGVLRPADTLARWGGDEFVVFTEGVPGVPELCDLADRMLTAVRAPLHHGGRELAASISIGVVFTRPGQLDPDQVLRHADVAMYRAKRANRGSYTVA